MEKLSLEKFKNNQVESCDLIRGGLRVPTGGGISSTSSNTSESYDSDWSIDGGVGWDTADFYFKECVGSCC